jgi:hypothetical protein
VDLKFIDAVRAARQNRKNGQILIQQKDLLSLFAIDFCETQLD